MSDIWRRYAMVWLHDVGISSDNHVANGASIIWGEYWVRINWVVQEDCNGRIKSFGNFESGISSDWTQKERIYDWWRFYEVFWFARIGLARYWNA